MSLKTRILRLIERATAPYIYQKLPHGVSLYADIPELLPACEVRIVFDVGANVGQSAAEVLKAYPQAAIYCFEPVKGTFATLKQNMQLHPNVHCFNYALGMQAGEAEIAVHETSLMSSFVKSSEHSTIEKVAVITLDGFCSEQKVEAISLLKIDTEGGDLNVLRGASTLLGGQRVDLIQLEAGMSSRNQLHVPLEDLRKHLEGYGYFLFGIYEQVNEWPTRAPHLRRTNPVFISERVIQANTRKARS